MIYCRFKDVSRVWDLRGRLSMDLYGFTYTGAMTFQCGRDCVTAMGDTEHGGRWDLGPFVSLLVESGTLYMTTRVTEAKDNGEHPGAFGNGPSRSRGLAPSGLRLAAARTEGLSYGRDKHQRTRQADCRSR